MGLNIPASGQITQHLVRACVRATVAQDGRRAAQAAQAAVAEVAKVAEGLPQPVAGAKHRRVRRRFRRAVASTVEG